MAFTPFAGSAGRMKAVAVTPALSTPQPTLTGLTTAAVAGITGWDLDLKTEDGGGIVHFESSATSGGVLMTEQLQGGVGTWSVKINGIYDGDTTATEEKFVNGAFVQMDLLYSRASTYGRYACNGKVKDYQEKWDVKANAVVFSCTVEGHSTLPAPSIPV